MPRLVFHLLLPLVLPLLMTACGTNTIETGTGTTGTTLQAQGDVMFPPSAGTVTFQANTGSNTFELVSFLVDSDGHYSIQLPVPSQLSAAGNVAALPRLPDIDLLGLQSATCPEQPQLSTAQARLAVVTGGTFTQSGQLMGQLLPAPQAVGGLTAQELVSTKRQYAYTDRDISVTGTLNCTFVAQDGSAVSGQVLLDYQLKAGWNTLALRTSQQTRLGPITMQVSAQTALDGVQWRFLPLNP